MKYALKVLFVWICSTIAIGCGIYSFSGTSLQPDIKTIYVADIENRAMQINPTLASQMTQALQDKYRRLTKLEAVSEDERAGRVSAKSAW